MKSINCAEFMSKKIVFSHGHQFTSVLQKASRKSSAIKVDASCADLGLSSGLSCVSGACASSGAKASSLKICDADMSASSSGKSSLSTVSTIKNCRSKKEF